MHFHYSGDTRPLRNDISVDQVRYERYGTFAAYGRVRLILKTGRLACLFCHCSDLPHIDCQSDKLSYDSCYLDVDECGVDGLHKPSSRSTTARSRRNPYSPRGLQSQATEKQSSGQPSARIAIPLHRSSIFMSWSELPTGTPDWTTLNVPVLSCRVQEPPFVTNCILLMPQIHLG